METNMQNVGNKAAKTVQKGANKGKDVLNQVASQVEDIDVNAIYESAKDSVVGAFGSSQAFVKRNPLYVALGVAAIGVLAGALIYNSRRR